MSINKQLFKNYKKLGEDKILVNKLFSIHAFKSSFKKG